MAKTSWHSINSNKVVKNELCDAIKRNALQNILSDLNGAGEPIQALRRWWCRRYNRPYKDPLFDSYTFEELLLEYYENLFLDDPEERKKAAGELLYDPEEEEAWLKEQMGKDYMSQDEMIELLKPKSKGK